MEKTFYITTPIYYPSGKFHIGTAYTTILADALARYHRQKGEDVYFLTGLDEHGEKIQKKSMEEGITPQEYVDRVADYTKNLWKLLNITNTGFIRTTDKSHMKSVSKAFLKLYNQGDIYLGKYKGKYCVPCETFYTESQLVNGMCPSCGREVKEVEEETYFFNMKKYESRLKEFYKENPDFLVPVTKKNEIMNSFINVGIEDLCISRTTFDWGIPVPNDSKHVMYVWLDALLNYVTALGYNSDNEELFKKYWPANVQIIGKDILRFHAIYWPIFLMALDLPLPKKLFVHDFIMMKDGKMSKSKGNTIYPDVLAESYSVDAVRYTILRSLPYGQDGEFTPSSFIQIYNTELCNDLGNLVNRTIAMINKYFDGVISKGTKETEFDKLLDHYIRNEIMMYEVEVNNINIQNALSHIMNIVSRTNKYIDETMPWVLFKEGKTEELKSVMYNLYESIRKVAILFMPYIPESSEKIFNQLNVSEEDKAFDSLISEKDLSGNKVIEKGIPLFERLKEEEEISRLTELMKTSN